MILAEKHIINESHPSYGKVDNAMLLSKNMYNATLYAVRQEYIHNGIYIPYATLCHQFMEQRNPDYIALPAKVAQQTMKMVDQNMKSFFKSIKAYNKTPDKFKARPKLPKYLHKTKGRYMLIYTSQAISKKMLEKKGVIVPSGLDLKIKTDLKFKEIKQVTITKGINCFIVNVLYEVSEPELLADNGKYAAIDLGVSNLATVTSNCDMKPVIIDGRYIKSVNHHYNKRVAKAKTILDKRNNQKTSKFIHRLGQKRKNRIDDYFHKASRYIVNQLVSNNVHTLIIGKNKDWKQDTNMGKTNNQNFVCIPFNRFTDMIEYKCRLAGISVIYQEESHTSKCSFLDREEICHHDKYVGRRVKRGLFRTADKRRINADVNGSYNILRKCKPNAFSEQWYIGCVVHPVIIKITKQA